MQQFDKIVNRRGTNCYKYDEMPNDDTIALWVADMDFETAPCITDALKKRMEHGCFGYTLVPESFYDATINWFAHRHSWYGIKREWMLYTSGVVPAVSAIIKAITKPGDKVLLQTPAYNCFYSSIRNNDCEVREIPLIPYEATHGDGNNMTGKEYTYFFDIGRFERECADPDVKVFLLCNPHNPSGRVWTREELQQMGDVCKRNGVFVIADEIHCEFVNEKLLREPLLAMKYSENRPKYHPFMSVSDAPCAVCLSPSKAFNTAGLQIATIIAKDDSIRRRINRAININEVCDVNPFGIIALEAAYSADGEKWLKGLNEYIYDNYRYVKHFIEENIPQWHVYELEGTYLMWVEVNSDAEELCNKLLSEANVYINSGTMYDHSKYGHQYIRINIATQHARLEEAMKRISQFMTNKSVGNQ